MQIYLLKEPARPHERVLWNVEDLKDVDLDELPDEPANNSNFEYYLGYYALLDEKLGRLYHLQK